MSGGRESGPGPVEPAAPPPPLEPAPGPVPAFEAPPPAEFVLIGLAGRPHGIGGALWARATGPTLATLVAGSDILAVWPDGRRRPLAVDSVERLGERLRLTLAGVTTREEAARLGGAELRADPSTLPPLEEPDTFYVRDLIGVEAFAGERRLGLIRAVHPAPANDALEIATEAGPLLVPFTADAIVSLDLPSRRLDIRPGLLPQPEA